LKDSFLQLTTEPKHFIGRVVFFVLLKYIYYIQVFGFFFKQKKRLLL